MLNLALKKDNFPKKDRAIIFFAKHSSFKSKIGMENIRSDHMAIKPHKKLFD